jgi:hypothetical protein
MEEDNTLSEEEIQTTTESAPGDVRDADGGDDTDSDSDGTDAGGDDDADGTDAG